MSKSLIIAEKPSVAGDIAKAIGGFKKVTDGNEHYYESDSYVLSSAVGHLVELCLPGELDKKKGKWSFANLPVIPDEFALKPIERSEGRLRLLRKLMKRTDVTSLVNACDAGREGELIFRYIVKLAGCKKPIERLWLQSMTPASIRDGFTHLRPGSELEPLASAAVCRSESDWLVGINGTRALTAFNSRNGGFQLTPVGRVQTPTLAIVVERDQKIKSFVPKGYWEVHATFAAQASIHSQDDLEVFAKKFAADHKLSFPFVVDPQGKLAQLVKADSDLGQSVGIQHTPTIWVVTNRTSGSPFVEVIDRSRLFTLIEEAQAETAPKGK